MTIFGEIDWFTMWRHWWDLLTWNREYNINPYHSWPHPSTTSRQTGSEVVGHLVTPQVRQLGLVVGVKTAVFLPCQPKRLPLITALDIRQFKSSFRFPLTSMTNKPLGSRKYPPTESNMILVSMLTWIFIAKSTNIHENSLKNRKKRSKAQWELPSPVALRREATWTVSPKSLYLGILIPDNQSV